MVSETIRHKVREYISRNFAFGENGSLENDQSLLVTGAIDSTGLLELIAFVQEEFNIQFDDSELVASNFDTVNKLTARATKKVQVKRSNAEPLTSECIRDRVREYILENFVFEEDASLGNDQSLLKTGVVDSTGILELIAFVQAEFNVDFDDSELVASNFDTVNRLTACLTRKAQVSTSVVY